MTRGSFDGVRLAAAHITNILVAARSNRGKGRRRTDLELICACAGVGCVLVLRMCISTANKPEGSSATSLLAHFSSPMKIGLESFSDKVCTSILFSLYCFITVKAVLVGTLYIDSRNKNGNFARTPIFLR